MRKSWFLAAVFNRSRAQKITLRIALASPAHYIRMIGSYAKCRTILGHLKADGFSADLLQRVYAPIGLNLGVPLPEEIAVSILAEVIAVQRGAKFSSRTR